MPCEVVSGDAGARHLDSDDYQDWTNLELAFIPP